MQISSKERYGNIESPIYTDLTLYKAMKGRNGRVFIAHMDGGISCVMRLKGMNSTALSQNDYQSIFNQIQTTIDAVKDSSISIQFVNNSTEAKVEFNVSSLPNYLRYRADYFKFLSENNRVFEDQYYLSFYIAPVKQTAKESLKALWAKIRGKEASELIKRSNTAMTDMDYRAKVIADTADSFFIAMKSIGFMPEFLNSKEEVYNLIQDYTCPETSKAGYLQIDDKVEIARQALFSGSRASINLDDFILDNTYHRVYTMDRPPQDYVTGKTLDQIKRIPYPYTFSMTFNTVSYENAKKMFKWKAFNKMVEADAANHGSQIPDLAAQEGVNKVMTAYERFIKGESTGVRTSVNLVVKIPLSQVEKEIKTKGVSFGEWKRSLDFDMRNNRLPKIGRSAWAVENYTSWIVFNKMIPGFGNLNSLILKESFYLSENVPYFMNLWSNKKNIKHNGVNHFYDEEGRFITFDLADPELPAWNFNFAGETGSGKSVWINTILAQQYAEMKSNPPVICILDVGGDRGSYYKLMELSGGESINLSRSRKPNIQIFEILPDFSMPTDSKVNQLIKLLKVFGLNNIEDDKLYRKVKDFYSEFLDKVFEMNDALYSEIFRNHFGIECTEGLKDKFALKPGECQPEGKFLSVLLSIIEVMISSTATKVDGYDQHEMADILELIKITYDKTKGRFPYMTDFFNVAKEEIDPEDDRGRLLLTKLENWTMRGAYGMFDADTNVNLNADTILVDVKGLDSEPALQTIYTMIFNNLFENKMYKIRGRRKVIVRDEGWAMMKTELARKAVVEGLRTYRKSGTCSLFISQFPTDVLSPSPEDGRAILGNTQVFFIGKIANQSLIDQVTRELQLPAHIASELPRLGNIKDENNRTVYSRFLMKVGDKYTIIRNVLHPFENMLYSSSETDNLIIDFYKNAKKRFSNLEDVLDFIAKKGHYGDRELVNFLEKSGSPGASQLAEDLRKKI